MRIALLLASVTLATGRWALASDPGALASPWPNSAPRLHVEAPVPSNATSHLPNAASSPLLLSTHELIVPADIRLMIFAPHPDDETLGAGGLIQRVLARGGAVQVVFVTNGDAYVDGVRSAVQRTQTSTTDFIDYGRRRHDEAARALRHLGLTVADAVFLGFPDDGIDDLWAGHWSARRPYTSPYTRFDRPPYEESLSRNVEYAGSDLQSEITATLRRFKPDWILMPDPRDRHPDHCTTGVFVLNALRKLRQEGAAPFARATVLTYLVHYPDYPATAKWMNEIQGAGVGGSPTAGRVLSATHWLNFPLNAEELTDKGSALSEYQSQVQVMTPFLKQFLGAYELFGKLDAAQVISVPAEYAARFRR